MELPGDGRIPVMIIAAINNHSLNNLSFCLSCEFNKACPVTENPIHLEAFPDFVVLPGHWRLLPINVGINVVSQKSSTTSTVMHHYVFICLYGTPLLIP